MGVFDPSRRVAVWGKGRASSKLLDGITSRALKNVLAKHGDAIIDTKVGDRRFERELRNGGKVSVLWTYGDVPGMKGLGIFTTFKCKKAEAMARDFSFACAGPSVNVWPR